MPNGKHHSKNHSKERPVPALIVFGLDGAKAKAGWFAASEAELAQKAADALKLRLYKIESPQIAEVAKTLPRGRVYANGRGFVPFVRRDVYERLIQLAGNGEPPPGLPRTWDEIDVGHLVIAHEGPNDGWWEAIVTDRKDDVLTLRWRDFPKQPKVVRHRSTIALLKPTVE
jgi:hypothetical protein